MENLKVLVVDDESGIRSGIKRILRNFSVDFPFMDDTINFTISEAATGEDAINIIKETPQDIILLDNKLPGMQGIEVLEHINKNNLDTLVIMITSYTSLDLAVKATKFGAYDFVSKPFTPQELRASMENITKHLYLLRMTRKMSEEGKQIRFQFLSVLSHELKAPINAVEGYLKMMQTKDMGDNIDDYEQIITRCVQRIKGMRHLIMDLLDFTRIEFAGKKRELETVCMKEIAHSSIDTLKPYAIQKDIKINLDVPNDLCMQADAKEIEIIFNNLISNAIKYNKKGGKVDIKIVMEGEQIKLSVADTGFGMTLEDQAKLFNDFVRIKTPKTKNINGSGLGLSITKKIAGIYGGEVSVKSEPDKGSTFFVTLMKDNEDVLVIDQ